MFTLHPTVGENDGVKSLLGETDVILDGFDDDLPLGAIEGILDGFDDDLPLGATEGILDGFDDDLPLGAIEGILDGLATRGNRRNTRRF